MINCYIYALVDPRTGEDFYVGSTINPKGRLTSHLDERYTNDLNWERINQIIESGEVLEMRILEITLAKKRSACEQIWIDRLRNDGAILTNMRSPMLELIQGRLIRLEGNSLWYVSGNREQGDVFAIPVIEVEEGAVILDSDIARLKDSDVDGARRWIVVAADGEEAVEKLARFCLEDPEEALPALAEKTGIPYDTLARYAREGRILARKSGGVWLSTKRTIEAAGIKPRH